MIDMSTKPWSNFKESDYTPEQWKAACLIVRGDGSTKAQCSLPVREPDGTLNHNALIAAAAVLAGARGGVNASNEEKSAAQSALRRLYSKSGMIMPQSLMHLENPKLSNFLAHFGIKGQRWGVRRSDKQLASINTDTSSVDAVRAHETLAAIRTKGSLTAVSDADLNHLVNRINLEKRFAEVDPSAFDKGHKQLKKILDTGKTMNDVIKFVNSPAGNLLADQFGFSKHGKHALPIKGSKEEALQKALKKAKKKKT